MPITRCGGSTRAITELDSRSIRCMCRRPVPRRIVREWGGAAADLLRTHAPNADALADIVGISVELAEQVYPRVFGKLAPGGVRCVGAANGLAEGRLRFEIQISSISSADLIMRWRMVAAETSVRIIPSRAAATLAADPG
jgi:hypothetical protein